MSVVLLDRRVESLLPTLATVSRTHGKVKQQDKQFQPARSYLAFRFIFRVPHFCQKLESHLVVVDTNVSEKQQIILLTEPWHKKCSQVFPNEVLNFH